MKRNKMTETGPVPRIFRGLREIVATSTHSLRKVAEAAGTTEARLTRLLQGNGGLKLEEVFHLLAVLDVRPYELFGHLFPLAGEPMAVVRRAFPRGRSRLAFLPTRTLDDLARSAGSRPESWESEPGKRGDSERRTEGQPSSIALALRAGRLLALKIRRSGWTQGRVARRLGVSASGLSAALTGRRDLTLDRLFAVLEVIEVTPGRYFAELLGASSDDLASELAWTDYLDAVEAHLRPTAEELARSVPQAGDPEEDNT